MRIFAVVFLLLVTFPAFAQEHSGKVVGIADGDTLTLLTADYQQLKIRLAQIDTPEKGQPYGDKAKQVLADLVFQENVKVIQTDTDRYGRIVGKVYKGQLYINAMMVEQGAAWVYREYATDQALFDLETKAKELELGLWKLPEAQITPPWEWRADQRSKSSPSPTDLPGSGAESVQNGAAAPSCESKRYCKQMASCAEARFYLTQCGLTRLDGDGDGVPCESICR